MTAISKKPAKKGKQHPQKDDPNAVHDVYTEKDLDPAYDETIADDIAFDYDGASGDPGDREKKMKKENK
jgi:hypothetical protein